MKLIYLSFTIIAFSIILTAFISCSNSSNKNEIHLHEQGVFDFLSETGDIDEDKELPSYIDPEAVLCFGKGLKVGRCISKQLETGICVGLTKHHKHVIAIEIPCDTVAKDSTEHIMLTE